MEQYDKNVTVILEFLVAKELQCICDASLLFNKRIKRNTFVKMLGSA